MTADRDAWVEAQLRRSAAGMLRSVSPVALVKARSGFGQTVRGVRGAIVASPVLADWDPDPDYFFHWFRDSAFVVDALRCLAEAGLLAAAEAAGHLGDFLRFSLGLHRLDGRDLVRAPAWREAVLSDFRRFLRSDAELSAVHGAAVDAETRVNADGTLDISSWGRPQADGPALRAIVVLRWLAGPLALPAPVRADAAALLRHDLAFTRRRWREPAFDPWEEEKGESYFTLRLQAEALAQGAAWLAGEGEPEAAERAERDAQAILAGLDRFWSGEEGLLRARLSTAGEPSGKDPDIAVILAANEAGEGARHSVRDPRVHASLDRLAALFRAELPINRDRPQAAPALGRYRGDTYFEGGAWYIATLAAARLCYRAALAGYGEAAALVARGEAFLDTVRAFTPADGALSEQVDRRTGMQRSARQLAWSHAAFIACAADRRAALSRFS